jgi:hypothetical protein
MNKYSFYIHDNKGDALLVTRIDLDTSKLSEVALDSLLPHIIAWAEVNNLHVYSLPAPDDDGIVPVTNAEPEDSFEFMQKPDINPSKLGVGATVVAKHDITYGMLYPELVGTAHYNGKLVCVFAGTTGIVYHKPDPRWYVSNKLMVGVRWAGMGSFDGLYNPQYVSYDWIEEVSSDNQSEH